MINTPNPHGIRFPNPADLSDKAWARIKEVIEALPANATASAIRGAQAKVDAIAPIGLFERDAERNPAEILSLLLDKLYDEAPDLVIALAEERYALPDAA